jgi:WD40 repeat protein
VSGEILWVNSNDGAMQIWVMDGAKVKSRETVVGETGSPEVSRPPWNIVGIGDFGGNGVSDILWVNSNDGTMAVWLMDGAKVDSRKTVVSETGSPEVSRPPWNILGIGDFHGDFGRENDLLWVNSADGAMQVWLMNINQVAGRPPVVGESGEPEVSRSPWNIAGVGEFRGFGSSDILWVNSADGAMQIWTMNGAKVDSRKTVVSETGSPEVSRPPWNIAGIGKIGANGRAAILWKNSTDGAMQIWTTDGAKVDSRKTVVSETGSPEVSRPPWNIAAVGEWRVSTPGEPGAPH